MGETADSAPPYELHEPVQNRTSSGYAPVPEHNHDAEAHSAGPSSQPGHNTPSSAETTNPNLYTWVAGTKPDAIQCPGTHCKDCDTRILAREKRQQEALCCSCVALVFIVIAICTMLAVMSVWGKKS